MSVRRVLGYGLAVWLLMWLTLGFTTAFTILALTLLAVSCAWAVSVVWAEWRRA